MDSAPAPASAPPPAAAPILADAVQPASNSQAPSIVLNLSQGISGGYVLDWTEKSTGQVLVQIPMQTAFKQFTGTDGSGQVGKTIDTEV
jgi:hypothetical protein